MESITKNETDLPKLIKPLKRQSSMNRFSYFMNHTSSNEFSSLNLENLLRDYDENLYNFSSKINNSKGAGLENERMMIEMIKSDEIDEMLKDFILKNRVEYEHYNQAMNKTRYANKDSRKEFFEKFNKFAEITRKGYIKNNTPSFEFIKACKENSVVPNPLGLIKRKGASNSIKLKGQRTGDEYLNALSKGVRYVNHIKEIDLSANRLTHKGVFPLINSIKQNPYLMNKLKILDLSYNKLGAPSIDKIIEYLREDDCDLQELNLEGNHLGNEPIRKLCEKISNHLNYNLSLLNLGKNSLNDDIAKDLGTFVRSCHSLKIFILCWNHFKNNGASIIVNNIKRHPSLKIFDISWNCIGNKLTQEVNEDDVLKCAYKTNKNFSNFEIEEFRKTAKIISINKKEDAINKSEKMKRKKTMRITNLNIKQQISLTPFAKELGEYFRDPTIGLVHLDISHNNLNYEDCFHLAQEVKYNHTILGIHVDGNEMGIDELGFLLPKKRVFAQKSQCADSQIYYKIGKENSLITSNIENVKKIRAKNNCWICEGWREITFSFTPKFEIINPDGHFVKLHLSFDNWKPYDSYYSHGNYYAVRMCPPGEVSYFFTIDKTVEESTNVEDAYQLKEEFLYRFEDEYLRDFNIIQMKNLYSGISGSSEELERVQNLSRKDTRFKSLIDNKNYEMNRNVVRIKFLRKINVEMNNKVVDKNFFKMFNYCDPRPEKNVFQFTKPRTPWNFSKSIWGSYEYKYEGEPDGLIDQMFEFDYNWGSLNKEISEDPEGMKEVKKYLRSNYKKLLEAYKFLSAYMGSALMQLSENTLTEFFNSCPGLLDQNYILYFIFIQQRFIKSLDKEERVKYKNIPDNIIRHQFLILLVKVAKDKYLMKNKRAGISTLLDAVKYSFENHFLPTIESYDIHNWRKERYYIEQVDNFIKAHLPILDGLYKTFAKNKDPGKKEVWMVLDNLSELTTRIVDSEFPVREIPILYNISMKWQVDEIHTDRAFNMQFPEFLEALCRIVDKISPIPPDQDPNEWPKQRREQQPLVNKLENLLPAFIKNINHPDYKLVKEKFNLPVKDKGLYDFDPNSGFYQKYFNQFPKMK